MLRVIVIRNLFRCISIFYISFFISSCSLIQLKTNDQNLAQEDITPEIADIPEFSYLSLPGDCLITHAELKETPPLPSPDLWDRVRGGYQLKEINNKAINQQLKWYAKHPEYINRVVTRGEKYLFHIVNQIDGRDMPMELALLPIVESAFDPFAYSHGRASGLWQIIPGTGRGLGLKQNWWYDGRRDVLTSTNAALNYLESLHARFDGDWLLALAAYNAGGGNVSKAIRKNKKKNKPTDFWSLKLPRETRAYVPKLIALSKLFKNPELYGLELKSVADAPFFAEINVKSQIDLAQIGELAELDMDTVYQLNPGFNRWATDPDGPHHILVPVAKAKVFQAKLDAMPDSGRVTWDRYTIKSGDSLISIAKKFSLSVSALRNINDIRGSFIRAGKTLIVPIATESSDHYSLAATERLKKRRASSALKESGHRIEYQVKSGDSLWSIAKAYGVRSNKIARWNNMALRDPIKPGQKLVLWTKTPHSKTKKDGQVIRKLSYKVRSGDSLHLIADKFRLNVKDILRWNHIDPTKYLQPGQSLTLFVDVRQTAGS